jgi:UDP-N-acetylglucosamine transferase subunit ALG13
VIFVTVGSNFPFDRLVRAVDAWAEGRGEDVLAQTGAGGGYAPRNLRSVARLDRAAFDATVAGARLVIAHAGVGSVVTAARFGRPVVAMPRRRHLGEHTSDHQVETAGWLRAKPGVWIADDETGLAEAIAGALAADPAALETLPPHAPPAFLARLRAFIRP